MFMICADLTFIGAICWNYCFCFEMCGWLCVMFAYLIPGGGNGAGSVCCDLMHVYCSVRIMNMSN